MGKKEEDEELVFLEEDELQEPLIPRAPWRILVVDDEDSVHRATQVAFQDFLIDRRPIEILSAHSGARGRELLEQNEDLAAVFLDVVMETTHEGLDIARWIREELNNQNIRIILRTGQPGYAPPDKVIQAYEINDYQDKTELTAQKLRTICMSAVRAYRDIMALQRNRKGLERIIAASSEIFATHFLEEFASGSLELLASFLQDSDSAYVKYSSLTAMEKGNQTRIVAATGDYAPFIGKDPNYVIPGRALDYMRGPIDTAAMFEDQGDLIIVFEGRPGIRNLIFVKNVQKLSTESRSLLNLHVKNLDAAFKHLLMAQSMDDTQLEVSSALASAIELRNCDKAGHIRRIAEYTKWLALDYGMDIREAEYLKQAAPLHDIGQCAIPSDILIKPDRLTADEWSLVKNHPNIGYELLRGFPSPVMQLGATIALQHHEKFDGSGYPVGLEGGAIHIAARIVAIVDVFDSLTSRQPYRDAWTDKKVHAYIIEQRGRHFDPDLVELLLNRFGDFVALKHQFPD
ncbi:HD domain-containing phosphohydrolase [Aestuariispira insulae]|uniref:Response regulator RpfG family c-di-GMP phosphodiesterase n=1 Tax=Aestuariispira insulae TaxID=1461337 RepID=A0A3D9HRX8_9PROT|nr:HD domain-containing phosphohydrolase [Aestuariispira insulae]RED52220.1 response regulator RpfG family c-di-GMP phosphodiesterase [Aestuariispira insulae]